MHGSMPGQTFQTFAHIDQAVHLFVFLVKRLKLRIHLQCLVNGDTLVLLIGNHLGQTVHIGIGQIHHSSHIPDHTLGRHRTEGDNLHNLVGTIFLTNIVNNFLPSFKTEIHIDIRHGHPLRI